MRGDHACHRFRVKGSRRGAAYVLALVTLLVGVTLSLAMLRSASGGFTSEDSRNKRRAAMNMAEAGVDYALWQMHYNGQRLPYSADVTLTNGSFHVDATDDGARDPSTMYVVSTGACPGHSYTVRRVVLGLLPYHYGWCENRAMSTDKVILSSGAMGAIRANGSINLNNTSDSITTGVWSTSTITYKGTVTPRYASSPPVRFPDIDYSYYSSVANYTYWWGATFSNLDCATPAIVYVHGDVNVSGWYRGVITIVATGNVSVRGNLWPADQNSYLTLMTDSDINVENTAASVEAVLYAHSPSGTGDVHVKGATTLTGSAAADDIANDNSVTLVRDTRLTLNAMRSLRLPGLY